MCLRMKAAWQFWIFTAARLMQFAMIRVNIHFEVVRILVGASQ